MSGKDGGVPLLALLLSLSAPAATLAETFPPPDGATAITHDRFADWIGALNVEDSDVPVTTYRGEAVHHRARVIDLPMVGGDLQQCADSAIRLRAEFLKETGGEVMYHATSGDPIAWSRWQAGERPYEEKGRLNWRPGTSGGWEAYLSKVFLWAGTRSLSADTEAATTPRPGDIVVMPGAPGHAIVLLDVAKEGADTYVLVGEGYMPAQSFHVELGPLDGWWRWDDGVALSHWDMKGSGLRRWLR